MAVTDLRRKVAWLIAIRAVVSTLLLGSAIFARITSPKFGVFGRAGEMSGLAFAARGAAVVRDELFTFNIQ